MSVPYKKKPARVKDKVRKAPQQPGAAKKGTLGATYGTVTSSGSQTDTVPYKKKPARKGRPDGA